MSNQLTRIEYPFRNLSKDNRNLKYINKMFEIYIRFITKDPYFILGGTQILANSDDILYVNVDLSRYELSDETLDLGCSLFKGMVGEYLIQDELYRGETGISPNFGGLNRADWYVKYGIIDVLKEDIKSAKKFAKSSKFLEAYSYALKYDVDRYLFNKPMTKFKLGVNKFTRTLKNLILPNKKK